jgi:hypothetical protein
MLALIGVLLVIQILMFILLWGNCCRTDEIQEFMERRWRK